MLILVLGGVGYIGFYMVDWLVEYGMDVVVVDNLVMGYCVVVNLVVKFYQGDLWDVDFLNYVFDIEDIEVVVYFVVFLIVLELMSKLLKYFDNNIGGMIMLFEMMQVYDVK